jgi:acetolactate synthase I/II/III large subunit
VIHRLSSDTPVAAIAVETGHVVEKPLLYHNAIVKKPWGYEYLAFENDYVAIWILHIIRKRKTSMHCHPRKKTGLILLSGTATFRHQNGSIELQALDGVVIDKGTFHLTEATSSLPMVPVSENGIWVMEIESPPLKTDLVRIGDEYGRAGASYEGANQMVFNPSHCLTLAEPTESQGASRSKFFNNRFTVTKGRLPDLADKNALISIIGLGGESYAPTSLCAVGDLDRYETVRSKLSGQPVDNHLFLTIERANNMIKLSEYIFSFIADIGVREVFAVSGGGAMHLVDAVASEERLRYIATHHEQAAAMAAEGYARITGKPGVALVTSGPGGTNATTGVCGAWIDSIPTIFISGQVTSDTLIADTGLRQFGIQESNIVDLVRPITKYAVTVTDPLTIKYHLQKAYHLAITGRPGPVWLDIPLDVQGRMINLDELGSYVPEEPHIPGERTTLSRQVEQCIALLRQAERPVLITGYGIRLARAEQEIITLVEELGIPVISSWTSSDLIPTEHELYIGRSGIMGDRAGNFTVQNADLLLILGSRMSIPQVGYNFKTFARSAQRIVVDIDQKELDKPSIKADLPILADAGDFIRELLHQLSNNNVPTCPAWLTRCREWKAKYPVVLPEYRTNGDGVNSFHFVDQLAQRLGNDAVVVTDMGTSFTCTMQTFRTKAGQRLFTSSGHASMGFGLPGAIGACFGHDRRQTICISGDGGLQMNIQELQTLVTYKLPVILFVLNNGGYLTIKLMQQNHFGRYVGSDPGSGVICPDIIKVATAYGIPSLRINNQRELDQQLDSVLNQTGPFICEIMMPEDQPLIPRVSSLKKPDGTIISKPLEDLYPFLDREEFAANMIVTPVEVIT